MDIKVSSAINPIVEFLLPRFSPDNMLLHIPVSATVCCYSVDGRDTDVTIHRDIHFLFHRPSNYTKVFMAVFGFRNEYVVPEGREYGRRVWVPTGEEDRPYGIEGLNELDWHMTSDHDSCWRSDGVDSPLFQIQQDQHRALEDEVDRILEREHTPLSGPNASWHVSLDPIGGRMGFVAANIIPDPTCDRGYLKLPTNIRNFAEQE